jgi:hypothetical protein
MAQIVEVVGLGNVEFPDGMSKEQIGVALQKLPAPKNNPQNRGNVINSDVPTVVGERPNAVNPQPVAKPTTMMDRVKALYEVPEAILRPIVTEPLSMAYGVARSVPEAIATGGNAPEIANKYYKQASQAMQFQPTSPVSQEVLGTIGETLQAAKIPPYLGNIGAIPSAIQKAPNVRPVVQESVVPAARNMATALRNEGQMIQEAVQPVTSRVAQAVEPVTSRVNNMADALRAKVTVESAPPMSGVGAAEVPLPVQRTQMAEQLRVPIKLSKGQATRDLGQQQFEAETMKTYPEDVGRPLIAAQEQRNTLIGQNLDAYVDATGAQVANPFYLRPTGEAVDTALRETANASRKAYKNAYDVARASEEGQQKVNVQGIINTLDDMEAEAVNASVIDSAKMKLKKLAPDGEITLNNLEEVRKMVGAAAQENPTQGKYGGDIKKMIDVVTEDAGGDLFKEARRLRTKFANEFENIGLIDDLLSQKPNSKDRVIAMEKVFDKAVMQSDLDSLKALGYTLKKTEKGQQAWAELKGQTIENLRSAITSNIETDSLGQRTFNPKQFDVIVKNLDKSGKLDYLLGKAGAQEIRNLRDTVITINSPVKGINQSNTSSAINKVFNGILKKTIGKVPFGGAMVEAGAEAVQKKNIAKQVEKSLEFDAKEVAKELRKGK